MQEWGPTGLQLHSETGHQRCLVAEEKKKRPQKALSDRVASSQSQLLKFFLCSQRKLLDGLWNTCSQGPDAQTQCGMRHLGYLYGSGRCSGISNANWWNFCVSLQTAYQWACCYCYAGVIVRFRSFFVYLDVFEKPYINKHSWEFSDFYKDCNLRHPQDWGGNKSGKQDTLTILITYGTSWRKEVSQRALRYVLSKTPYSWS